MRALLVVGALLLCGPVSAQEGAMEALHVVAPCLPDELLMSIVDAQGHLPSPMGLDENGVVWTSYIAKDGSWSLVIRAEGRTCMVTAGVPGSWLGYVPEK